MKGIKKTIGGEVLIGASEVERVVEYHYFKGLQHQELY